MRNANRRPHPDASQSLKSLSAGSGLQRCLQPAALPTAASAAAGVKLRESLAPSNTTNTLHCHQTSHAVELLFFLFSSAAVIPLLAERRGWRNFTSPCKKKKKTQQALESCREKKKEKQGPFCLGWPRSYPRTAECCLALQISSPQPGWTQEVSLGPALLLSMFACSAMQKKPTKKKPQQNNKLMRQLKKERRKYRRKEAVFSICVETKRAQICLCFGAMQRERLRKKSGYQPAIGRVRNARPWQGIEGWRGQHVVAQRIPAPHSQKLFNLHIFQAAVLLCPLDCNRPALTEIYF